MDAADSLRALGGPCRWDEAALDALEYGRGDVVALIFRSRGNDIDSKVQGGCYGRQILARRGYRLAALGLSRKSYETGDTLFHLAVRNDAPIEFLVELLARGARLDVRNAKRQTALDIDVDCRMNAAYAALELRPRSRRCGPDRASRDGATLDDIINTLDDLIDLAPGRAHNALPGRAPRLVNG
mmetsp:Transcript_12051/g.41640  ORF Transcript_12051/g.41640 Transcript_12051/m.41640 type:complete len:184 (-) Transcript_12051:16-567(-)